MTGFTVKDIARIVGGELHGDGAAAVTGGVTDSRDVTPGCLFAALPGKRRDGHEFIPQVFEAGASCCLALRVPAGETRPVIVTDDVEKAFKTLAASYRAALKIPVIGVTGSVGKTTGKEMIACVLSRRYNVLKTEKNHNNELGVPLTLLRIDACHDAAVVEMGISDFGEMTRLAEMARPTMAVYTIIGSSHLQMLGDRRGVYRAKTELLPFLPADGKVFANGDDDLLAAMDCPQKKIFFGMGDGNSVRAENVAPDGMRGTSCDIVCGCRRVRVYIPAYGRHMVYAALAGAAVGMEMGLTDDEIAAGIAAYEAVGRRSNVENTGYITLIDDCYNSNPNSLHSAVDSMAGIDARRVLILGDMLELGPSSRELHRSAGEYAAAHGAGLVLTAGPLAENISAAASEKGCPSRHFADADELMTALPETIRRGDAVLVKASNGMHFERISEELKKLQ